MNLCSVKDGYILSFMGSMVAGFITTVASLPLDIAKTRIQNMKTINGVPEYKGMLDVMTKVSSSLNYLTKMLLDCSLRRNNLTLERLHALLCPHWPSNSSSPYAHGRYDDPVQTNELNLPNSSRKSSINKCFIQH